VIVSAGRYDLTIEQGATFARLLTLQRPAGTPMYIGGRSFRAQIRRHVADESDPSPLATFACSISGDQAAGQVLLTMDAALTATLTPERYNTSRRREVPIGEWDLEMVNVDGSVERLLFGEVVLSREVTR
jgi:hypothetical protein